MSNTYTPIAMLRGNSSVIDETPIVDGQILFDESRKCLFMDDGDTRSKYSGLGADSNVATVEDTTTSTHTYAKGDYVVVEGQLYEVTAAIAIGDTFTVGTNITQTTVGDELVQIKSDLSGWGTLTTNIVTPHTGTGIASSNATKVGPFARVTVVGSGSVNIENNGIIHVGNLPTEYRPKYTIYVSGIYNGVSNGQVIYPCTVGVLPSGDINLYVGRAGGTVGNSSYPWSTSSGTTFWYHL